MSTYNSSCLDLLAEHKHVVEVLGQGSPALQSRPWTWRNLNVQGTIAKMARHVGPGCSQPSTSIAGCFSVESYCRHEGLTPARTDAGNVAALGNGDEIPMCSCHVSAAGDSNRDLIYCNCSAVVTLTYVLCTYGCYRVKLGDGFTSPSCNLGCAWCLRVESLLELLALLSSPCWWWVLILSGFTPGEINNSHQNSPWVSKWKDTSARRSVSKIPLTRVKSLLLSQNFCWLWIAALTCAVQRSWRQQGKYCNKDECQYVTHAFSKVSAVLL